MSADSVVQSPPANQTRRLHWTDELEVVLVRIGERGDPHLGCPARVVGLLDHRGTGGSELLELTLHVGSLDVPDHPAGVGVLALHLVVRPDAHPAAADLPAGETVSFVIGRLPEELRVVRREMLRILGSDQDAVQVHASSFLGVLTKRLESTSPWSLLQY